jgi:hypothetical protein
VGTATPLHLAKIIIAKIIIRTADLLSSLGLLHWACFIGPLHWPEAPESLARVKIKLQGLPARIKT